MPNGPQIGPVSGYRLGLVAARASLETGNWEEAQRYLRAGTILQRTWDNQLSIANSDFRAFALGEFYQAKVFEHAGKKEDAVNAYQEFLSHFENYNARLPQIAEARAALKRLL